MQILQRASNIALPLGLSQCCSAQDNATYLKQL